jgi:hypothetical protein
MMLRSVAAAALVGLFATPLVGAPPTLASTVGASEVTVQRSCPDPEPGYAQCYALVRTDLPPTDGVMPAGSLPYGLSPSDLHSAYTLPNGTEGTGLTVAIVDAFDLPTAEADLAAYRSQYGLPSCTIASGCFRQVTQTGQPVSRISGNPNYVKPDSNWGGEIALDMDMVSATCPNCKILLVEANDNGLGNLAAAVDMAASLGAIAISNSYGGPEWDGESDYDKYYNHPGIAITVSTGDCGYECSGTGQPQQPAYPAASPYVVAVGGTHLNRDSSARGWSETAWSGAGSGCSRFSAKPGWQHDTGCANRTQADVSAVADPCTPVAVYAAGHWTAYGGTSAAAPIIAAVYALAGTPKDGTTPASYLYADPANLNDVTSGNNDSTWHNCTVSYLCNGTAGFDGPTGLGTPKGVKAFAAPTVPAKPSQPTATAGDGSAALSWTAPANGGSAITSYTVTETKTGLGVVQCTGAATACTVANLTNGVGYQFTVHASNAQGDGPESDPSAVVTPVPPTVPGKPTAATAVAGIGSISVSWAAAPANGSAVVGYEVTSDPEGKKCTTNGELTCTVSALTNGQPYTFTVTATNGVGVGPASDPSRAIAPVAGSTYHGIPPVRLLDTRCGNGIAGKLSAGKPGTVQIATRGGIPAGATAITGNATIVNAGSASSLYLGPTPIANPATYTLNFNRLDTTAYGVTVALASSGTLSATYMATSGTADLVLDVTGYFTADGTGATYHPLAPSRVLDTRIGNGLSGKLRANSPRTLVIWGRGGVPSNAIAVTANVAVTNATYSWAVYIGPYPIAKPLASSINFAKKQTRANSMTLALSATGTLSATYMSSGSNTTDLVLDITGYYTADSSGATYVAIPPIRTVDTRVGNGLSGRVTANQPRVFQVTGRGGIPANASAVTAVVNVINQTSSWAVFVGPTPTAKPASSALNFLRGEANANGVTVALATAGTLSVTYMGSSGNKTDVVLTVTGYFVPPAPHVGDWAADTFDPRADRFQDPDYTACTAAATVSMLNVISYSGQDSSLTWSSTTSYTTQESILSYERQHMTMLTTSLGTDPHGWRNALNYYGWGSMTAGVYRDSSYASFEAAAKAAISALARFHKPVGILALAGKHAQYLTGYQVSGDDPSTGSMNFTIVGVDMTDPLQSAGRRDSWVPAYEWENGAASVKFSPYMETDSPYTDPIDGTVAYGQWYGQWVIIDPTR